jgi:hypothetical protein
VSIYALALLVLLLAPYLVRPRQARARPRSDRDLYLACLPQWAEMYVAGHWTLAQFEAHADRMREALFPKR